MRPIRGRGERPQTEPGPSRPVEGNPVKEKSFVLALSVVRVYKTLVANQEFVISKQLLKSGTSIGANVEEATAVESRRDFLHKMTIASKEARETLYWLRLLKHGHLVDAAEVADEIATAEELVRILTAITKSTSSTLEKDVK